MAKPLKSITPPGRLEHWKRLWAKPKPLSKEEAEKAFDEFVEQFIEGHMQPRFFRIFGEQKAQFGNRFFREDARFYSLATRLDAIQSIEGPIEATVIYGGPEAMEAHQLRGEGRRTLRDLVVDDWFAACAIIRTETADLYAFCEPKGGGAIVRSERRGEEPLWKTDE